MRNKLLAALLGVVLAFSVWTISAGVSGNVAREIGQGKIPKAFVDAYALSHHPTVAGANAEWNKVLTPQMRASDVTMPGGTMTYGEARHPRHQLPSETPVHYLNYLSEVGKVRRYTDGLLREWNEESSEFVAQQNSTEADGLVADRSVR